MKFLSLNQFGFIGILLAILCIFLIVPLFTQSVLAHILLQTFFTLLFLSIIALLNKNRLLVYFGSLLVFLFVIFDSISLYYHSLFYLKIAYTFYSIYVVIGMVVLLKKLFSSSTININMISCAITVYLLAGVLWGKLYFLISTTIPNSFKNLPFLTYERPLVEAYNMQFDLLYFSFTTLATLGLGDIYPLLHLAKSLTIMEAIFGQLFIAIVIAKMVAVWTHSDLSNLKK